MGIIKDSLSKLTTDEIYHLLTPQQRKEMQELCNSEPPTPEEFAYQMQNIANRLKSLELNDRYFTQEQAHMEMDDLMCDLLLELGYETGVRIFQETPKWYS